jgi:predicted acyl esterase
MKKILLSIVVAGAALQAQAQAVLNGKIDNFSELTTVVSEEFVMPDGVKLMTDLYLPLLQDCLMVPINIDIPSQLGGGTQEFSLELIPRGKQFLIYETVNGLPNPNPQQLPMILSRTPYDKGDQNAEEGAVIGLLGYVYAKQDMRGRYTSGGVYLPLMSDSYNKNAYHPNYKHVLDKTPFNDARNGNRHEDGIGH